MKQLNTIDACEMRKADYCWHTLTTL